MLCVLCKMYLLLCGVYLALCVYVRVCVCLCVCGCGCGCVCGLIVPNDAKVRRSVMV